MLHLTTIKGERLEIPAGCISTVIEPCDGANPCSIVFNLGGGFQFEALSDQYKYVKKLVTDNGGIINGVEVRLYENVTTETGLEWKEGKMFFSRSLIAGRRQVIDDPNGVNCVLYVDIFGAENRQRVTVLDTIEDLDGAAEVPIKPVSLPEPAQPVKKPPVRRRKPKAKEVEA